MVSPPPEYLHILIPYCCQLAEFSAILVGTVINDIIHAVVSLFYKETRRKMKRIKITKSPFMSQNERHPTKLLWPKFG
jgi:hypothetical protein